MFDDAFAGETLKLYLATKKQSSIILPERSEFYLEILATMKRQYFTDVIRDANSNRFKAQEDSASKYRIVVSPSWMEDLTASSYYLSK